MTYIPIDPSPGETFAYQWLTDVYGQAEADTVMVLPTWELRMKLYPEVLMYGPSGFAVLQFFDAVAAADVGELYLVFHELWARAMELQLDKEFLPESAVEERFLWNLLQDAAEREFAASFGGTLAECAALVGLALSAHRFPLEVRELFAGFGGQVDSALRSVGLPAVRWGDLGVQVG